MLSNNDIVSMRQVKLLFIIDLYGTASLIAPRLAVNSAKQDGWISLLLATLIAMLYCYVLTKLVRLFPRKTIVEFAQEITNKFIGSIISFVLLCKLILACSIELRIFGELTKQILLPKTPIEVIMITMLLTAAYLARKGYECRARLGEISIYLILIPIGIVLFFGMLQIKVPNLAPIFISKPTQVLDGAYMLSFQYSALEIILLSIAFVDKPQKSTKAVLSSVIIVGAINLVTFFITVGNLGIYETENHIWPVMTIMKIINIPIIFVERLDALMMLFWILVIFTYVNAKMYFSSIVIQRQFKIKTHKFVVMGLLPVLYIVALLPDSIVQGYEWLRNIYRYAGLTFMLPVPLILLIIAKIRKLGEQNVEG